MIDIHSHIIPEFDDGSRSLEESIEIATIESKGGTTIMFATPHVEDTNAVRKSPHILELVET